MASYFPSLRDRMIHMTDDLPKPTISPPASAVGSIAKESAPLTGHIEAPLITEIGKEMELPPEVAKAGVSIQSDTVVLPPPVAQRGVKPVGAQAPASAAATIALPLSDDQIAKGLQQSLTTSWRWLAEWCKRQLLQARKLFTKK